MNNSHVFYNVFITQKKLVLFIFLKFFKFIEKYPLGVSSLKQVNKKIEAPKCYRIGSVLREINGKLLVRDLKDIIRE